MGAVGDGAAANMTALGDSVNVTARLASLAEAGEILVTADAALAAGVDTTTLPHKSLELKGRQQLTEVVSMRIDAAAHRSAPRDRLLGAPERRRPLDRIRWRVLASRQHDERQRHDLDPRRHHVRGRVAADVRHATQERLRHHAARRAHQRVEGQHGGPLLGWDDAHSGMPGASGA